MDACDDRLFLRELLILLCNLLRELAVGVGGPGRITIIIEYLKSHDFEGSTHPEGGFISCTLDQ